MRKTPPPPPELEDDPLVIAAAEECVRTGKPVRAYRDRTGEYIRVVEERSESLQPDAAIPWRKYTYAFWCSIRNYIFALLFTICLWLLSRFLGRR